MNDEAVQRLARLEGKMESISEVVQRIETVVQRIVGPIDRSLAELTVQVRHMGEKLQETREATVACNEAHKATTQQLSIRINDVHDQHEKFQAATTAGLHLAQWLAGGFALVVFAVGGWFFAQVGKNTEINAVQQQRIEQLERLMSEVRHQPAPPAK